jgi:hypothetical protein
MEREEFFRLKKIQEKKKVRVKNEAIVRAQRLAARQAEGTAPKDAGQGAQTPNMLEEATTEDSDLLF